MRAIKEFVGAFKFVGVVGRMFDGCGVRSQKPPTRDALASELAGPVLRI